MKALSAELMDEVNGGLNYSQSGGGKPKKKESNQSKFVRVLRKVQDCTSCHNKNASKSRKPWNSGGGGIRG